MNYPIWDVGGLGAGLVVAIIAIIHVLISHVAVGGGAFLVVAEIWSRRQPDGQRIRDWLHKFATFFLVYTTVVGATTGVGIWFSIQLASAEATSLLIHQFVFAWAIEWVFFLGELTVLYLYYYGFKRNTPRMQTFLAGAYFVIAWGSLVVINGILTFMLTPGAWTLENKDIAAGFFNPGYFPALLIRTVTMFLLAGLAGFLVASRIRDEEFKARIIQFCVKWVIPAAILVPGLSYWYFTTLPASTVSILGGGTVGVVGGTLSALTRMAILAGVAGTLLVVGTLVFAAYPKTVNTIAAISMLLVAQLGIMGAEFFREMGRKPYVIHGVLYSNGLWVKDAKDPAQLNGSYLEKAKWHGGVAPRTLAHGEQVFRLQCASCHTRDGYRSVVYRTRDWTPEFGSRWLGTMQDMGVMPPFQGDALDKAALVAYVLSLRGETVDPRDLVRDPQATAERNGLDPGGRGQALRGLEVAGAEVAQ
ncbi:MAG TPA: cytochrome c [Verrucomicrobiota bacterium]|nr:cytochrome c [Verrucomicrobiota bacterium]